MTSFVPVTFLLLGVAVSPAVADPPDRGSATRVGAWMYLENTKIGSCGVEARDTYRDALTNVRTISWDGKVVSANRLRMSQAPRSKTDGAIDGIDISDRSPDPGMLVMLISVWDDRMTFTRAVIVSDTDMCSDSWIASR